MSRWSRGEIAEPNADGDDVVHSECLTGDVFGSRRCDCGRSWTPRWRGRP